MSLNITFGEAFRYWLKLGFISFGGPAGQIAIMHKDLVETKRWVAEDRFLQALNFCMLLPGPEAQQLATYIGWLLHGTKGGLAAGILFVLPSVFILWGLSWLYVSLGAVPGVAALFYGLKPAVTAIVAEAVLRIGRKSLKNGVLLGLAALAFAGIYVFRIPFPVIVLGAALIGYWGGTALPERFAVGTTKNQGGAAALSNEVLAERQSPTGWARAMKILALYGTLWVLPLLLLGLWRGWGDIFIDIGVFFSKAAVVTFGGAYAVLTYISRQAVDYYGWLRPEQMIDGLGLAETTPGPLIMVTQFVGYTAAYTHAQGLSPAVAGAIGGLLTTWVTFVPCFLWIFLFAPYIEKVRKNVRLSAALAAITAAVVGVILNLAVFFAMHTLLPKTGEFDLFALALSLIAFIGMVRFKWGMVPVIVGSAAAGFIWKMLF